MGLRLGEAGDGIRVGVRVMGVSGYGLDRLVTIGGHGSFILVMVCKITSST